MDKEGDYREKYKNMLRDKALAQTSENGKPDLSTDRRLTELIGGIAALQKIQEEVNKKCEQNKKKLDSAGKLIHEYHDKIERLEVQKKELEDYKIKYEELQKEFKKNRAADKSKGRDKAAHGVTIEPLIQLAKGTECMERVVSSLKMTIKTQKKAYDDMCYSYQKQLTDACLKKMDDSSVKVVIDALKKNVGEQNEIIQALLQKRKINPERDRLLITWLSAMLDEECKKNKAFKKRPGDIGGKK